MNFIGKIFNRLTIIGEAEPVYSKQNKKIRRMKCSCACGTDKIVILSQLKSGHVKSCGCLRKELIIIKNKENTIYKIGDRFGRLVIIEFLGYTDSGQKIFKCQCDCSNTHNAYIGNLVKGHVQSCGCLQSELRYSEDPWQSIFDNYKKHELKERDFDFLLTREEFEQLCKNNCFYCDSPPNIKTSIKTIKRSSIDRVDNTKGYTIENSVPSCAICNKMKLKDKQSDFLYQVYKIYMNYMIKNPIHYVKEIFETKKGVRKSSQPWEVEFRRFNHNLLNRNRTSTLSFDEFKSLCSGDCYYCACPPNKKMHTGGGMKRSGIDRVDNNKNYNLVNCVSCCWDCNRMKNKLEQKDFLFQIEKIYLFKMDTILNVVDQKRNDKL